MRPTHGPVALISCVLLLSACSRGPSDSQMTDAMQAQIKH